MRCLKCSLVPGFYICKTGAMRVMIIYGRNCGESLGKGIYRVRATVCFVWVSIGILSEGSWGVH